MVPLASERGPHSLWRCYFTNLLLIVTRRNTQGWSSPLRSIPPESSGNRARSFLALAQRIENRNLLVPRVLPPLTQPAPRLVHDAFGVRCLCQLPCVRACRCGCLETWGLVFVYDEVDMWMKCGIPSFAVYSHCMSSITPDGPPVQATNARPNPCATVTLFQ